MTYQPQEWADKETVITAERLRHMEQGISTADSAAATAQATADTANDEAEALAVELERVRAVVPSAAWRGSVTVSIDGVSGSAPVTFPEGLFQAPPPRPGNEADRPRSATRAVRPRRHRDVRGRRALRRRGEGHCRAVDQGRALRVPSLSTLGGASDDV